MCLGTCACSENDFGIQLFSYALLRKLSLISAVRHIPGYCPQASGLFLHLHLPFPLGSAKIIDVYHYICFFLMWVLRINSDC